MIEVRLRRVFPSLFFFNDTATTEIYTLSLHDALPICHAGRHHAPTSRRFSRRPRCLMSARLCPARRTPGRSEEHTSELQSRSDLVCRLLLEKKKHDSASRIFRALSSTPSRTVGGTTLV